MEEDKKTPNIGLRLWKNTKDEFNYIKDEGIIYEIILIGVVTFSVVSFCYIMWPYGQ